MITTADLETQTRRDLAGTARGIGISGWHSMKKEELIKAIRQAQESARGKDPVEGESLVGAKDSSGNSSSGSSSGQQVRSSSRNAKAADKISAKQASTVSATTAVPGASIGTEGVKRRRPVATKQPAKKQTVNKSSKVSESQLQPTADSKGSKQGVKSTRRSAVSKKGASSQATSGQISELDSSKPVSAVTTATGSSSSEARKRSSKDKPATGKPTAGRSKKASVPPRKPTSPEILKVLRKQQASAESRKDLSACVMVNDSSGSDPSVKLASKERIVLIVRDSYWLQASWVITRSSVERARAAMGADWHTAEPVLRLLEVAHGASANTAEQTVRDIPIHGGVNNWYIDVENPPSRYRVVIGYRSSTGRFFTLFRSNIVLTPEPGACDPIDGHWQDIAEDYERIYSLSDNDSGTGSNDLREMFEERLQRPMLDLKGDPAALDPDLSFRREKDLPFQVDAELIVYGSTAPGASVTLSGSPVRLRPDGTFTVRMELPDRRQVIPVVACSRDGLRQRTTVVAVERNTKAMEPVSRHQLE